MKIDIEAISGSSSRHQRRLSINTAMTNDLNIGHGCSSCVGHCCTYEHNSMQVTPLEALDAYKFLLEVGRVDESLIARLEDCVTNYRLDKEVLTKSSKSLRRYYTCPFYKQEALGCSLDRDSKPYGCLAFNPSQPGVSEPGFCSSNQHILEKQSLEFDDHEERHNETLREELKIYWNKMNLPNALLYLIKSFADKK